MSIALGSSRLTRLSSRPAPIADPRAFRQSCPAKPNRLSVEAQDFDAGRRGEHLAEGVHPVAGLLGRADPAVAELVELIETGQLDLELQCRAVAVTARQRHQQRAFRPLPRAASTSRRMNSIARVGDRPAARRKKSAPNTSLPSGYSGGRRSWPPSLPSTRGRAGSSINGLDRIKRVELMILQLSRCGLISSVNDFFRGKSC